MFMIKSKISHHVNQDYEANMNALEGLQSWYFSKTCPLLLTLNGHSLGALVTLVLVIFFFSFFINYLCLHCI